MSLAPWIFRLNPRRIPGGMAGAMFRRHVAGSSVSGFIVEEAYFGTLVQITTGQGGQTADGNIDAASSADATIATGQGSITTDISSPVPYWLVTITTGHGQGADGVIVGAELSGDSGQGGQSTAATLYQYQTLAPTGFWDNENSYSHQHGGFWQINPRRLPSLVQSLILNRDAPSGIAQDAFFSAVYSYTYGDGFGQSAQLSSFKIDVSGIAAGSCGSPTIYNLTQYLLPSGLSSMAMGTASIYNNDSFLLPSGIAPKGFGTADVSLASAPQTVYPSAIAAGSVGSHTIYNYLQTINLSSLGFTDEYLGTPIVDFVVRRLRPSAIDPKLVGTPTVVNFDRQIYATGSSHGSFGMQFIAYKVRFVYPPFIATTWYGTPTIAQREMPQPLGFTDEAFGNAFIHDNRQSINVTNGIRAFSSDAQGIDYDPRHLFPRGFTSTNEHASPSDRWGIPDVYNLTQYLRPYQGEFDEHEEMGRPIWTIVENRNRTTTVIGWDSQKVAHGAFVENTGRPLLPDGIDSFTVGPETFIAYKIRHVYPTDPIVGYFGRWLAVSEPPALKVIGIPPGAFGLAAWSNPPQTVKFVGNFVSDTIGVPFIAQAIRTITVPLGPESAIGAPAIALGTRYLSPASMPAPVTPDRNFGSPYVEIHRNIFKPRSILPWPNFEGPWIHNKTPQLYTFGKIQTEWGQADIRYNPFPLSPAGWDSAAVSRQLIEHRERTVYPHGWLEPESTDFNQIRNVDPDPPSNRPLGVAGWGDNYTGVFEGFGLATVRRNEIHPDGFDAIAWGAPEARLIGAIVPSMVFFDPGVPTVSGPQYVYPDTVQLRGDGNDPIGRPFMSPYTIFCSFTVPTGYTPYASGEGWHIMDYHVHGANHPERPVFGTAEASNEFRAISVPSIDPYTVDGVYKYDGYPDDTFGEPSMSLKDRKIYPDGIKSFKYGFPSTNFPIEVGLEGNGIDDTSECGSPSIQLFDRQLVASNWYSFRSGVAAIENFNREIVASGWDSQKVSADRGVEPYANTRIHFPEPIIPGMGVQTLWGADTFIADRIRHTYPEGFLSFTDTLDINDFGGRATVRHATTLNRHLLPRGFEAARFGEATLTQFDRC